MYPRRHRDQITQEFEQQKSNKIAEKRQSAFDRLERQSAFDHLARPQRHQQRTSSPNRANVDMWDNLNTHLNQREVDRRSAIWRSKFPERHDRETTRNQPAKIDLSKYHRTTDSGGNTIYIKMSSRQLKKKKAIEEDA